MFWEQVTELKQIAQTETEAVRAQLSAAHERELSKVRDEAAAAMARLQEEAEVRGRAPLIWHVCPRMFGRWGEISQPLRVRKLCPLQPTRNV